MHDFDGFCYLDVPRTGSTYISTFLTRHSRTSCCRFAKHAPFQCDSFVLNRSLQKKLFFISARDPVSQWLSLYSYGCGRHGFIYKRLAPKYADLYDGTLPGFCQWVGLLLDPANAPTLDGHYSRSRPDLFGFQTYRHLLLSFEDFASFSKGATSLNSAEEMYKSHKLHSHVIKTESLATDLSNLVRGPLGVHLKDPSQALEEIAVDSAASKMNASFNSVRPITNVPREVVERIRHREQLVCNVLGY